MIYHDPLNFTDSFSENDKSTLSEEEWAATSHSEGNPELAQGEDPMFLKRQFKTAEMADAVMGSEAAIDPSDMESLFPKNVQDVRSAFSPPCDDAAERPPAEDEDAEMSQQVRRDVHRSYVWTCCDDYGGIGDIGNGPRSYCRGEERRGRQDLQGQLRPEERQQCGHLGR